LLLWWFKCALSFIKGIGQQMSKKYGQEVYPIYCVQKIHNNKKYDLLSTYPISSQLNKGRKRNIIFKFIGFVQNNRAIKAVIFISIL
jgi:hypothetical protein